MQKTKLHWAFTILLSVLAVVGWTLHWHVTINNVHQAAPVVKPDGLISVPECASIKPGITEGDVVLEYGLPQDDDQSNGSSDTNLSYPLRENQSRSCNVNFDNGNTNKVNAVSVDLVNNQ